MVGCTLFESCNDLFAIKNSRAQQTFGMSFGMLFSIILIVVFIATAFIVIGVFLDFDDTVSIGQFYDGFQDSIDSAWRSSQTERAFAIALPEEITHVCFGNLSAAITNRPLYEQITYIDYDSNVFMIPSGAAGDLDVMYIDHLDIARITENQNPYCVSNPGEITISKGVRSRLVVVS